MSFQTDVNMSLVMISLMEKETTQLKTEHYDCKTYNQESEFIDCTKKQLWNVLSSKINCTIAGLESIVQNGTEIEYCSDSVSARQTFDHMVKTFDQVYSNLSKFNCPVPCRQKGFNYKIKYFHKNSWIEPENSTMSKTFAGLYVSYSSLLVEERVETIVYDLECLLTSLGGNLGLFLGFSCFSTLVSGLNFIYKKMVT